MTSVRLQRHDQLAVLCSRRFAWLLWPPDVASSSSDELPPPSTGGVLFGDEPDGLQWLDQPVLPGRCGCDPMDGLDGFFGRFDQCDQIGFVGQHQVAGARFIRVSHGGDVPRHMQRQLHDAPTLGSRRKQSGRQVMLEAQIRKKHEATDRRPK